MCVNKVFVRDLFHLRHGGSYYPCGRCPSCRQHLANARSSKISSHEFIGSKCYFVTLTYDNRSVPYILRSEVIEAVKRGRKEDMESVSLAVYRDSYLNRGFGTSFLVNRTTVIGYIDVPVSVSLNSLRSHLPVEFGDVPVITGIRTKIGFSSYKYDTDKISVAYSPDFQKFLKRLRINYKRSFGKTLYCSYYYAPEYGPTSMRFHIHFLFWVDSDHTKEEVISFICKAWPWCSRERVSRYVEIARAPSHYVASYVNMSADIPRDLFQISPVRSSHSVGFGFNEDVFSFSKIVEKYRQFRLVTFDTVTIDSDGKPVRREVPYPKYVLRRYFPRTKGYGRCSRSTLRLAYLYPEKYFRLSEVPVGVTESGEDLYQSGLISVYGVPITFTRSECSYFKNSLKRFYVNCISLGIPYDVGVDLLLDFYETYYSYLYLSVFDPLTCNPIDNVLVFYNLDDVVDGNVNAPTIAHYLDDTSLPIDCNSLPCEVYESNRLFDQFNKNIKQRKIGEL